MSSTLIPIVVSGTTTLRFVPRGAAPDLSRIYQLVRDLLDRTNPDTGKAFTQQELADAMGVSQTLISDLKLGKAGKAGIHGLVALARYTGKSTDELLGLPPPATPTPTPIDESALARAIIRAQQIAVSEQQAQREGGAEIRSLPYTPPEPMSREELERTMGIKHRAPPGKRDTFGKRRKVVHVPREEPKKKSGA